MTVGDDDTVASSVPTAVQGQGAYGVGDVIAARYRIVRWLGGGGMGSVYEAVDGELGEHVALKFLRRGLSEDAIERFRREVKLTRRIVHRNVARMFDIGDHAGDKFLSMELVHGVPLSTLVSTAPLRWSRLQAIATQLCAGLAAAHDAGVVHRDLKPDNVLLEHGTERAVITDFGIARGGDDAGVTQVGAVVGTPRYMAPEQLAGREVDARADVFSLGVMLFELATGTRPWSGDNVIAIAVAQATSDARTLDTSSGDIPAVFSSIVSACLQLEPGRLPSTAAQVGQAVATGTLLGLDAKPATNVARPRPTVPPVETSPVHAPAEATTLAVLPIACGPGDEYLADGLAEDLTDTLSTTPGLRVRPAGITRGPAIDAREIGTKLGVAHVLSATLRRTPTGLRLTARLVAVADGFQTWAEKVELSEGEVFAVSERLAQGVARALSVHASVQTRPTDPRAVDLYLRARAEQRRFWGNHVQAAADLLERAAEIAPTSAPILGALAQARVNAWVMRQQPELAPAARTALERGLATGHADAYLASAQYHFNQGDFERGARDLGVALVRGPMSAPAHELAAHILIEVEGEPARQHYETAAGLDPSRSHLQQNGLARLDALKGDFASADRRIHLLVKDADPSIQVLGQVNQARFLAWRNRIAELADLLQAFDPRMGPFAIRTIDLLKGAVLTRELDVSHWRADWDALNRARDIPVRQQLMSAQLIIEAQLLAPQLDGALDTLDAAAQLGLMDITWLDGCPLMQALSTSRRFTAVRSQVAARAATVRAAFHATQA